MTICCFLLVPASYGKICEPAFDLNSTTSDLSPQQCPGGSVSYPQLPAAREHAWDHEKSFSAVTALANMHHAYCKKRELDLALIDRKFLADFDPSTRYDTLVYGLNDFFQSLKGECLLGKWRFSHTTSYKKFMDTIYQKLQTGKSRWRDPKSGKTRAPLIALINLTANNAALHWVSIANISGYNPEDSRTLRKRTCRVVLNQKGDQNSLSCRKFIRLASQVNDPHMLVWMAPFNLVYFSQ